MHKTEEQAAFLIKVRSVALTIVLAVVFLFAQCIE